MIYYFIWLRVVWCLFAVAKNKEQYPDVKKRYYLYCFIANFLIMDVAMIIAINSTWVNIKEGENDER